MVKHIPILLVFLLPLVLAGPSTIIGHPTKLILGTGETLEINSDSLHIDTLIMNDNSRMLFISSETVLVVDNAYIGKNCTWDAAGLPGENGKKPRNALQESHLHGWDGQDGRGIAATVLFRSLGNLLIKTSGGKGGSGVEASVQGVTLSGNVYQGQGSRGLDGSPGGHGGNAGNLSLLYYSDGFIPVFNSKRSNGIQLQFKGGKGGNGGRGGKGSEGRIVTDSYGRVIGGQGVAGSPGVTGKGGEDGKDGLLVLKRLN